MLNIKQFLKQYHTDRLLIYVSKIKNTTSGVEIYGHVAKPDDDNFEYFQYAEKQKQFDSIGMFTVAGTNRKLFSVSFDDSVAFGWVTMAKDYVPAMVVIGLNMENAYMELAFNEEEKALIIAKDY